MIPRPLTAAETHWLDTLDKLLEHGAGGCVPCKESDETAGLCPTGRPLAAAYRAALKMLSAERTARRAR